MFERFTDRARRVVVLSQEEARRLNHDYIGTEHLLLGLLFVEENLASEALTSVGVTLEKARETVGAIIGKGVDHNYVGHIPFTPRAKKALELSLREAMQFADVGIHPEHILLGLIREGEGVACQSLVKMGVDPQTLKTRMLELITGSQRLPQTSEEADQQIRFFADLSAYPATVSAYRVLRNALELAQRQSSPLEVRHLEMALRNT